MTINFNSTVEDAILISNIAAFVVSQRPRLDVMKLEMDITACHLNGTPLDLVKLDKASEEDPVNFWHDVNGILIYIDRTTGKLTHNFLPRHAMEVTE